ncbi:MAG: hypothetical protein FWJ70_10510 [Micromonosporaceae bacterium]
MTGATGGAGGLATGGAAGRAATVPAPVGHGVPASHRRRRWLLAALAVAAGATVSLARQPGAGALDTVWAEDGQVFLADAVGRSLPQALATPYAGYLHTGPRLIAEVAALVPAQWAAVVLSGAAAVVTAALALLVYAATAGHLRPPARAVAAAVVVVAPVAQGDLPNSVANLHWPALYALFWVLLWTPATRAGRVVAVGTTVLTALSDVLVVALLPLAAARLAVRRDRYRALLAAALCGGLAVQAVGLLAGTASRDTVVDPVRAGTGYVLRAVPSAVVGSRWLGDDPRSVRWLVLAGVAWVLVAGAVLLAVRGVTRPAWRLAAVAAAGSVALYALPVTLSGVATDRYAAAPAMLAVVALLAVLSPGRAGWPAAVLVTVLAVVCAANLRVPNARAEGPSWRQEVAVARSVCTATPTATVGLPVPPAGWEVRLPCRHLLD